MIINVLVRNTGAFSTRLFNNGSPRKNELSAVVDIFFCKSMPHQVGLWRNGGRNEYFIHVPK
jgi:hypothetical protein